ncbi:hypothetical protein [Amycolatopsis sp. CA-230715]|uniref:hypothetical protein n=1 Tax=Amycolatopsis sp. CA-230715 TaxID=2745196 RepID=UPI001C00BB8C|nr:hypothetical protein [Amycolatopsis sp. CA-230715]QWF76846.1 hypothetical protein HUW46_00226 [Amycolatopsis sp. CA-230715]
MTPAEETTEDPRNDPNWALVRAAAEAPVPTPPGLIARVLHSVHGLRGRVFGAAVEFPSEQGTLRVSERVLVLLARRLAAGIGQEIGGVHVSAAALDEDGLQVLLTVRYGVAAGEASAVLRARLHAALTDQLGGTAPPVTVHIVDVHPD